jgi:hypothetical protein
MHDSCAGRRLVPVLCACAVRNVSENDESLLTATQAAQAAGVSRWAIHRAIKSLSLRAIRDNRNIWRIAPDDLTAWCSATVAQPLRAQGAAQSVLGPDDIAALVDLRDRLAAAERREAGAQARADAAERARNQAEADRDHWRDLAQKLAERPRLRFWPWR